MDAVVLPARGTELREYALRNGDDGKTDAPRITYPNWHSMSPSDHFVQFYEHDSALVDSVCSYLSDGLSKGDSCIVIATRDHRDAFKRGLSLDGVDVWAALASGQYIELDAAETLSQFMVSELPDAEAFDLVVGSLVRNACASGQVRAFGEMVALLWSEGNKAAAIRLEDLWNELGRRRSFILYCAYPLKQFCGVSQSEIFGEICGTHAWVIPGESYTEIADDRKQLLEVARLQQKAVALEAEVARRKRLEQQIVSRERELSDFLENAVVPIHQVGRDGKLMWANRAELSLLGYEPEEYIGHHIGEFHVDQEIITSLLERLQNGDAVINQHARLRCKDGSLKYVIIDSNACFEDGEFVYTRCFTRDVTERTRAAITEHRLAAIVDSSDDAIIGKTLDGIITSWNRGAERIFGYTEDEVIGKPKTILFPQELLDEEVQILARLRRGERTDHFESVRVRKDGARIDVSVTISPIRNGGGEIIGASTIARDITESKRHQRELAELNAQLKRSMMETHHRVKNNLQVIAAMIELQAFEHSDEQSVPIEEFLRLKSHVRTLAIVHDLLTKGIKENEDAERVSAQAVLDQLLPMLQQTAWNRTVQYEIQDVEMAPKQCVSLALILNELVSNALKHGKNSADILFAVDDSKATLEVRDDGPGFPSGFDPALNANTGLELIENLVRTDLAGEASYENLPEGGARVRVTFDIPQTNG